MKKSQSQQVDLSLKFSLLSQERVMVQVPAAAILDQSLEKDIATSVFRTDL
jgi:hypothetical protein